MGFLVNAEPAPGGRAAGSLAWAGIFNTYYWLDPTNDICGVLMTQILPFADPLTLDLLGDFEREVYSAFVPTPSASRYPMNNGLMCLSYRFSVTFFSIDSRHSTSLSVKRSPFWAATL